MGGSLALALARARPAIELVGRDADPAVFAKALAQGLVREGDVTSADVVFLAAPIPALPSLFTEFAGHPGLVTDLASTKGTVMRWATAAGLDLVGGHPMCGRERSGLDAADPAIFEGAPWLLAREEPVLVDLVRAVGAVPVAVDAEQHDRLVAGVSHAAFALSAAYVLALAGSGEWEQMAALAGPGYRDMSRLAGGDPELHGAIASTNRHALVDALQSVEASVARLRRHLEAGDARLVELLEEAKGVRDGWERGRRQATGEGRAGEG